MSNGTNSTHDTSSDCFRVNCPEGKICVEDEDTDKGYRCCRSKKCVVKCDDPGTIPNAGRVPHVRDFKFKPKEIVIFDCHDGYYLLSNTKSDVEERPGLIKCQNDSSWSPALPKCIKFGQTFKKPVMSSKTDSTTSANVVMDPSPPTNQKTDSTTSANVVMDPPTNHGVIAVAFLVPILLLSVLVWLWYRYRNRQTNGRLSWRCREATHPVIYENTFPSMPENLEENAVLVKDFTQYVAVRHNTADRLFREEFEEIQNLSTRQFSWDTSLLDENQEKNRYTNIVAYEHTRVRLNREKKSQRASSTRCSDYINANYVSSYKEPKTYIACQGPLPETFGDFWKMIWENNVSVIVMITNLVENGRRKCDQYWPQDGREQYKHLCVTLRDVDVYANYTVRTFQIRDTKQSKRRSCNNERRVLQYHYTQWPDHGTPECILPILTFVRRSSQANIIQTAPIVVHCSAGVGRTGAYIVLHSMIQMALKTGKININKFLRFIRTQRNHLVQTEDQYIFLHHALLCHFACGNTECPAQQLNVYVQNLLAKPVQSNKQLKENGVQTTETVNARLETGPMESRTGMERQFLIVAQHVVRDIDYDFAVRSVNQSKNRSNGILPVFRSRVPLHYRIGSEGSDYINASFLQGYRNEKMFIITQLPMANTRKDFWSLVWDQNCSVIITIRDKDWTDANDVYWPTEGNQVVCPLFNVSTGLKNPESHNFGHISVQVRGFVVEATKDDYVLAVTQLDISGWPTIDQLSSEFTQLMDLVVRHTDNKDGGVVVQDRYGGTPAGQFACAHSLHQQLANENVVDVFQTVRVAYRMRPQIFKSGKDLYFLYKAMLIQTNPTQSLKKENNHEKASEALQNEKDNITSDKTPLLEATTDSAAESNTKSTEYHQDSPDVKKVLCDVKKNDKEDNDSHYDLIIDDGETKLLKNPATEKVDEAILVIERLQTDSKNNSTAIKIESGLDESVTAKQ